MLNKFPPLSIACFLLATSLFAQNQPPVITNLNVSANWATNTLTLTYDIADVENDPLDIALAFSDNGGKTYNLTNLIPAPLGDVGFPVGPGTGRSITCDISELALIQNVFTVRLVADDKQTFDLQQLVNEVDSARLRADLEFVQGIRHRTTGLAHLNEVRDSLRNHFSQLGLFMEEHTFAYSGTTGRNILGTFPGTGSAEKVVIVDAHYDTVNNAPGADDNGSGTVGVMEIARLLSRYPAKKTLRFIGFDMEEDGLIGSTRYVTNGIPAGEQIEGVFNFEMIGYYSEEPNSQEIPVGFDFLFPAATSQIVANQYRGDFITNVANANSSSLGLLFSNSAQQYVPDLKVITLNVFGNGSVAPDLLRSDHAPFWLNNKPALMLTDGADFRNECYHTPADTLDEKLNFTFVSRVVQATLAAAAQLAEIQHGDWATTTFQNSVNTWGTPDCTFSVWHSSSPSDVLNFSVANCIFTEAYIEVLDEKGSLLHNQSVVLSENEQANSMVLPLLSSGIYFAKITWPGGMRTQKFIVNR